MSPNKIAWSLVADADANALRRAAEEAWSEAWGDPVPSMEEAAVPGGWAVVGDARDLAHHLPSWGGDVARRLRRPVLILDLRDICADPETWDATIAGKVKDRPRAHLGAARGRKQASAVAEARRLGLLPAPPSDVSVAIVDGAAPRDVEEALARVARPGPSILAEPHPRGTLLRTELASMAPAAAAHRLRPYFPRLWTCEWSGSGSRFLVEFMDASRHHLADWGGAAWGDNGEFLLELGAEDSAHAVRAALRVTNPPGWNGA